MKNNSGEIGSAILLGAMSGLFIVLIWLAFTTNPISAKDIPQGLYTSDTPCKELGEWKVSMIPARCLKYFNGK